MDDVRYWAFNVAADEARRVDFDVDVFPGGAPPRDVEEREDLLAALLLPERFWAALTDEYNAVATEEDVGALVVAYVRNHAARFRLDEMAMTPPPTLAPPREPSPEGLEAIAAMERAMQRQRSKLS